ncbi:MAG: hypothetical protein ACLQME_07935 [Alphaproteobacteria bacterium]
MADNEDESVGQAVARGVLWTAAVPFRLGFYATKLGYRAVKGAAQQNAINTLKEADAPNAKARQQERDKQLAALKAAVPPLPPDRMRATIQLNEIKYPITKQRIVQSAFGFPSAEHVPAGEETRYSVDMILELPETDRAIIREHELTGIVLQEEPLYTHDRIIEQQMEFDQMIEAQHHAAAKASYMASKQMFLDGARTAKLTTRVGDLLVSPHSRMFETAHEANEYAEKLKTKLLPRIKELIDQYRGHKQSQTVEF